MQLGTCQVNVHQPPVNKRPGGGGGNGIEFVQIKIGIS